MTDSSEEFSNQRVPASHQVAWLRVGLVSAMVSLSLPTFLTGMEIFIQTDATDGLWALFFGCLLLALIAGLSGAIGTLTHLNSYVLTQIAFGRQGAALVNGMFALSLLGWFGVNIDLFGGASIALCEELFGARPANWAAEALAGLVMTTTTLFGFRAINALSLALVPVMLVVTLTMLNQVLGDYSLTALVKQQRDLQLSFGDAMSAVVGGVIVGAVIMPDITRFIRHWSGAAYTAALSYFLVSGFAMVTGGLVARALENDDLLAVMLAIGLGWGAFIIVIAGSWVLNALNLYSAVLSAQSTWPSQGNARTIIVLGMLGTGAAFANILDYFLDFLFYLSIIFVPVAGIIAVDFLFLRRANYLGENWARLRTRSTPALLAWVMGAAVALLGSESTQQLTGIAALDAMLAAAIAYPLLYRLIPARDPGSC